MQIIIPMSGTGDRFLRAGYREPKPLIEVDGKPIIEHVVSLFPGEHDFIFICNARHLGETSMRSVLQRIAPGCRIVEMESRKLGPVYAVLQAKEFIKDSEPSIVNYCDFSAKWDYGHFKRTMERLGCDGCITAYRGFHPHTLGSTYYAYMRTDEKNRMLQIREKESFTSDRMGEYASAGTYYFSKGAYVKKYFQQLMDKKIDKNGEYYVSLVYNLMNADGLFTHVYELEKFLQWGTPEDLEEYRWWSGAFALKAHAQGNAIGPPGSDLQIVVPMAGAGSRFAKEGYSGSKPLVSVSGKPMFLQAIADLPAARAILLIAQENAEIASAAKRLLPGAMLVAIHGITEGQASTVLLSKPHLNLEQPLLIAPCDTGFIWDAGEFARIAADKSVDCCVWAFSDYVPAVRNPKAYGWLKMGTGNTIAGVSCKTPVSQTPIHDLGVTGAFYFSKAAHFFEAAESMISKNRRVNGEFYVDEAINELVEAGRKAVAFRVKKYLCWGSPNELKTYQYWQDYFDSNSEHPYKKEKDEDFA